MNRQNRYEQTESAETGSYLRVSRNGQKRGEEMKLPREHKLKLFLNGARVADLLCTPQYFSELAMGYLVTEGLIRSGDKVSSLLINEDQSIVNAVLAEKTGSSQSQESGEFLPLKKIKWKEEWIFALADKMAAGMPLHQQTWGTHSCFLAREGELLFSCEDIGRHNTIDKAVGYALKNGIDLSECILYSSGRMLSGIAEKVIRAGIPIAASKAVPTVEAVELAKRYHLTVIGAARPDRMRIYT